MKTATRGAAIRTNENAARSRHCFDASFGLELNDGRATFTDSAQRLGDAVGNSVALGDVDVDGDLDAFVTASSFHAETVWINDGHALFTGRELSDVGMAQDVSLGDLDGDGDLDALLAVCAGDLVWLGDGAGNFTHTDQQLGERCSMAVALGDLDGDGDLDAFIADHSWPNSMWLNEGLAVYYSGEKGFASGSLVSKALVTNSIIPLSEIDEVLQFHVEKAQLAYQQSYLAVDYLFEEYGSDAVKNIIHKLGQGLNINQAFLDGINLDLWQFEDEWYEYIKRKFRWHFLVEFENFLWVFILVLFILGFLLVRRRNKRIIQQWQEEDDPTDQW